MINFVKTTLDLGHDSDVAFLDTNQFPVIIDDVRDFFDKIVTIYFESINEYSVKFVDIKFKRNIKDLVDL